MINNNSPSYFNYTPNKVSENKFSVGVNNNSKEFFNYTEIVINIPQFTQESMAYRNDSLINAVDILSGEESIYYDIRKLNSKLHNVSNAIPQLEKLESLSTIKIDYFNNITNLVSQVVNFGFSIDNILANAGTSSTSADVTGLIANIVNVVDGISTMVSTIMSHKEAMKNYDSQIENLNKQIEVLEKDLKLAKEEYEALYKPNRIYRAKSTNTLMKR